MEWNQIKCSVKTREGRKRGKKKNRCDEYKTVTNMVDVNPTISVIVLNMNGLIHVPTERQRLSE